MNPLKGVALAVVLLCGSKNANASDVPFTGVVDEPDICIIEVLRPGTLAQNADGSQLSSYNAGGQSGRARVTSFWFYQLQALHNQVWTSSPIANNQDTSFLPFFSGTAGFRGVNFADRPGAQAITLPVFSQTFVDVNLVATHNTSTFPVGNYSTNVYLLCE